MKTKPHVTKNQQINEETKKKSENTLRQMKRKTVLQNLPNTAKAV